MRSSADEPRERPAGAGTEGAGEAEAELLSPDGSRRRTLGPQLERMDPDAPGTGRAEGEGDPEREPLPLEAQLTRLDRAARWADGPLRSSLSGPDEGTRPAHRHPGGGAGAGSASGRALPGEGWEPDWGRAAADYLRSVLSAMDIQAEITAAFPENGVILRLAGEGLGVIIGRRGETLDALQYLCGLVANRQEGDYLRVTIDSGNYRQKRERTLEQLAKKLSGNVVRFGRPATLEPMNPYERRIIHSTVSKLEGVTSASIGEEPNRRVVISPTNPRPVQPSRGKGGRGGRPGSRDGGRDRRENRGGSRGGRDRREGGYREPREGGYRENRAPREPQQVTPLSVDQEFARQMEQGYVAPTPAEKPVTREVVPPTRAQARKEGEDLPLYGKIEL